MIDRETLLAELQAFAQQRQQHEQDIIALDGAAQAIQGLLGRLDEQDKERESAMPSVVTNAAGQTVEDFGGSRGSSATVAAAGSTTTDATVLTADNNSVSGANGTTGVRLPSNAAGRTIKIWNSAGSTLKVYPPTGGQINAGGADTNYSHLTVSAQLYFAVTDLLWYTVKSA